jgi:predicted O-linked N-acetylglucosamine transferase (SPINDLY family)
LLETPEQAKQRLVEAEVSRAKGWQALESDRLEDAAAHLSRANELNPEDGVVLGLLAVSAARLNDDLTFASAVARTSAAPKEQISEALRVGGWFADTTRLGERYAIEESANWRAFGRFGRELFRQFATDEPKTFFFAHTVYHFRFLELSKAALQSYVDLFGRNADIFGMLVDTQLCLCELDTYDAFVDDVRRGVDDDLAAGRDCRVDPYNLLALGTDYGVYARVCALRSARIAAEQGTPTSAPANRPAVATRRIRVGFLLPYSWFSSLNMVLHPLLPHFDRSRFEIYGYAMQTLPAPDELENAFRSRFDHWMAVPISDPRAAADAIRADGIDILLETSGHTRVNCLAIAAHRPAPVQAHYLGYSNAIAAPFIDYLIVDEWLLPPALQAVCPDPVALMPRSVATYPTATIPSEPICRAEIELQDGTFYFCSFNHLTKIEPKIFSAWLKILHQVPHSVLVLCHWNHAESVANLRYAAHRGGIEPARLHFVAPLSHEKHLRRIQLMDLALDTFYMGGGVTTLDALWAGLPLLTVRPDCASPHNGTDMLSAVDLPELIAPTLDEYVAKAVRLANAPDRLRDYRRRLESARTTSILFDHARYVRQFQALLATMWENHVAGHSPASFCARDLS